MKSTYSEPRENCVDVTFGPDGLVTVRDDKEDDGPTLTFYGPEWDDFIAGVKDGQFDRPT